MARRFARFLAFTAILAGLGAAPQQAAAGGVVSSCLQDEFEVEFDRALKGGGTVLIQCTGTNRLTTTKLIASNTTIQGMNTNGWLIGGGSNRLFHVVAGVELRLVNLRLGQGRALGADGTAGTESGDGGAGEDAMGGAILNEGGLVHADRVVFSSHEAQGGDGGAGWIVNEISGSATAGGRGGHARGGAICNLGGRVQLTDCQFDANRALGGIGGAGGGSQSFLGDGAPGGKGGEALGGAVYTTNGTVQSVNCTFNRNKSEGALGGAGGSGAGLIYFDGPKGESGPGHGGAVAQASGEIELEACTFTRNEAKGAAGLTGMPNAASRNEAAGGSGLPGQGGAVFSDRGRLCAMGGSFSDNLARGGTGAAGGQAGGGGDGGDGGAGAPGQGGALFLGEGTLGEIVEVTFSYNAAFGAAGGFGSVGAHALAYNGAEGAAGRGEGGAAWSASSNLVVSRCLFENNLTQGAEGLAGRVGSQSEKGETGNSGGAALGGALFGGKGSLGLTNTTFYANQVIGGAGGAGGAGYGGGLYATDGGQGGTGGAALGAALWWDSDRKADVVHCSFAANSVEAGTGGPGGAPGDPDLARPGSEGSAGAAAGAAVGVGTSLVTLRHTLMTDALGGSEAIGPITDGGCNLSADSTPEFESSLNHVDPLLGELGDHGGPTRTFPLKAGSPAIDRSDCPAPTVASVDQRRLVRDELPDVGAYEVDGGRPQAAITLLQPGTIQVGWPDYGVTTTLETSRLIPPTWSTVQGAVLQDGWWTFTSEAGTNSAYYRLRW